MAAEETPAPAALGYLDTCVYFHTAVRSGTGGWSTVLTASAQQCGVRDGQGLGPRINGESR